MRKSDRNFKRSPGYIPPEIENFLFSEEQKKFRVMFRKGAVEVILFLKSAGETRYPEIKSQQYVIGDRSLSRVLKELQKLDLIHREALPTVPVSTIYSLTDKGKLVAKHLKELRNIVIYGRKYINKQVICFALIIIFTDLSPFYKYALRCRL